MVVIVHEAVGVTQPVIPLNDGLKDKKKILPVLIAKKYPVPCITARGYMIDGVWIFNSQWSGPNATLA